MEWLGRDLAPGPDETKGVTTATVTLKIDPRDAVPLEGRVEWLARHGVPPGGTVEMEVTVPLDLADRAGLRITSAGELVSDGVATLRGRYGDPDASLWSVLLAEVTATGRVPDATRASEVVALFLRAQAAEKKERAEKERAEKEDHLARIAAVETAAIARAWLAQRRNGSSVVCVGGLSLSLQSLAALLPSSRLVEVENAISDLVKVEQAEKVAAERAAAERVAARRTYLAQQAIRLGSPEQQQRSAAGVLPESEVLDLLREERLAKDFLPRYQRLQAYELRSTCVEDCTEEVKFESGLLDEWEPGSKQASLTADEFVQANLVRAAFAADENAVVQLRCHLAACQGRDCGAGVLRHSALVTVTISVPGGEAIHLSREYALGDMADYAKRRRQPSKRMCS